MDNYQVKGIGSFMGKGYLETAIFFAEMAKSTELLPEEDKRFSYVAHRSFVHSSIVASACHMEATINEWYSLCDDNMNADDGNTLSVMNQLWKIGIPRTASYPILKKYQIALIQLGIETFAEGEKPYQDASLVIDLRNALVHYETTPEPIEVESEQSQFKAHKFKNKLIGKFPQNPLCADWAPFWPIKCLGSGCAFWAAQSAFNFVDAFFERTSEDHFLRIDKKRCDEIQQIAKNFMQI